MTQKNVIRASTRTKAILTPFPIDKAYDYALPGHLQAEEGAYVCVPLGTREIPAVVWGEGAGDVKPDKIKSIIAVYDLPPLPAVHRKFIDWVASYTMAAKGAVLKLTLSVPKALEPPVTITGYVINAPSSSHALSPLPSPPPLKRDEGIGGVNRRGDAKGKALAKRHHPKYEQIKENSRVLRKNMTDVEVMLWQAIRKDQLGVRFRKQHPIPPYIVDFVCLEQKLIIELDGGQHEEEKDKQRTQELQSQGYKILRFWNNEVLENFEGVLETIVRNLNTPHPNLPPLRRGEGIPSDIVSSTLEKGGGLGWGVEKDELLSLSPTAKRVMEVAKDNLPRRLAELAEEAECSTSVIKTLESKGLLKTVQLKTPPPCRVPDAARAGALLSAPQAECADALKDMVKADKFSAALLDGVTGAGKTEVYFEAVAQALRQQKQVLILLPEIALSNAFLDRFKSRFGCAPALWHSSLSPAKRKITWRGVAEGQSRVVIGARSALFLPYQDLGLIIVDEEHDPAYKQEEGVIYNARDMAVVRANLGKFPIVMVSATPSLETMQNAWQGRYQHLNLPSRHGGASLPDIHLIDLKKDKPESRQHFLSPTLKIAVSEAIAREEQALLFLNRRGYAPLTLCRTCGHRFQCPRCTAWLIEHRNSSNRGGKLHCHHCDYYIRAPDKCPECGEAESLAACGPGVERILEEVKEAYPEARVLVLSSDTATTHDELRSMLDKIQGGEVDIIIGTQIIAKGHHFPKLTCVGVVDADLGLTGGDLRATERVYQLLHQVAGRAGREDKQGVVYLQTFTPESRVMQALAHKELSLHALSPHPSPPPLKKGEGIDVVEKSSTLEKGGGFRWGDGRDQFLEVELQEREAANMPPISRLVGIIVSGRDEGQVKEAAQMLGRTAPQGEKIQTLGPAEAPMYRLRGKFRYRLLVRAEKAIDIQKTIKHWLAAIKTPSAVRVQVDIDPQSFY